VFGYILPEKPELKIREYELFRAYYCGICKSIGRRYGQLPRLTLNYDSTFLALLIDSVSQGNVHLKKERCIAHPFRKKLAVVRNDVLDYSSDINIILAYYSLRDRWNDERSAAAAAASLLLKAAYRKARKKYPEKCDIIEKRLHELYCLEKSKCASMDMAAEPFALLMSEVLAHEPFCANKKNEEIFKWIGYNLGKWIYILDAFDDIEDNIKGSCYNPLLCQYGYSNGDFQAFKNSIRSEVEFNLIYSLNQIAKAYELLEVNRNSGIIENIVYMGMLRKTEKVLGTGGCGAIDKSI
jgi:hypothetical protein